MEMILTTEMIKQHAEAMHQKYPLADSFFIMAVTQLIDQLGINDEVVRQSINLMKEREDWMLTVSEPAGSAN